MTIWQAGPAWPPCCGQIDASPIHTRAGNASIARARNAWAAGTRFAECPSVNRKRTRRGVTAFELGALLSFVALVGGAVAVVVSPRLEADRRDRAQRDAERIQKAALEWRNENTSGCPSLTQLVKDQVLARESHAEDPWGGRFRVICREDGVSVSSAGRDGKANTDDDVQAPNAG